MIMMKEFKVKISLLFHKYSNYRKIEKIKIKNPF